MWLTYGIDDHGSLVAVDDAPRGKTALRCPYCAGHLTAKKGQVVGHHFGHTGETCRAVDRADDAIALPLYDQFHLQMSGKQLQLLQELWAAYGSESVRIPTTVQRLADRLEVWAIHSINTDNLYPNNYSMLTLIQPRCTFVTNGDACMPNRPRTWFWDDCSGSMRADLSPKPQKGVLRCGWLRNCWV